jgi:hypothetical protein
MKYTSRAHPRDGPQVPRPPDRLTKVEIQGFGILWARIPSVKPACGAIHSHRVERWNLGTPPSRWVSGTPATLPGQLKAGEARFESLANRNRHCPPPQAPSSPDIRPRIWYLFRRDQRILATRRPTFLEKSPPGTKNRAVSRTGAHEFAPPVRFFCCAHCRLSLRERALSSNRRAGSRR